MLHYLNTYIKPALDVLIVAFIFYRVYALISRTRAIQLIIGFSLILVLDIMARWLQLETVSWLITNVSSYLVFGLIVLLQPELRRLIGEIGRMPIFQWVTQSISVPLDDIVEAVKNMAADRTGSIICILREIRPQNIIDNAVALDANVTRELIQTIFHKDTPLHDGAIMVEGNRIVAASCYLPLSSSRTLKKTHGARHRAGMGISEESDAIVIVTSEETGRISVMLNGELKSVKPLELKSMLFETLTVKKSVREEKTPPDERSRLRDQVPTEKSADPVKKEGADPGKTA